MERLANIQVGMAGDRVLARMNMSGLSGQTRQGFASARNSADVAFRKDSDRKVILIENDQPRKLINVHLVDGITDRTVLRQGGNMGVKHLAQGHGVQFIYNRNHMQVDVGLIGGTGVGSVLAELPGVAVHVPTRFGMVRGKQVEISGRRALVLSRHSAGHSVPPHRVNYRAMATGLASLGAKHCLATAAVGSLKPEIPVGTLVACSDFLDLSGRNLTLHDENVVHTSFANAFGPKSRRAILDGARACQETVHDGGVYLGLNGPRFETPHEIQMLSQFGDVVGMTAASEAIVMREAGIEYGLLAIVTNLGEGLGGVVEHELVGHAMLDLGPRAVRILESAVGALP